MQQKLQKETSLSIDNEEIDQNYLQAHPQMSDAMSLLNPLLNMTTIQQDPDSARHNQPQPDSQCEEPPAFHFNDSNHFLQQKINHVLEVSNRVGLNRDQTKKLAQLVEAKIA